MQHTRTLILASLLVLGTSAAGAQVSIGGGTGIAAGSSGSTAGMISGGGSTAYNLDAGPSTEARSEARATSGAESNASTDSDGGARVKAKRKKKTSGFNSFGSHRYGRARD
ncbi:MAG TPA: hypothetical protein VFK79_04495 [Xanthobacteraceae bacterium]|nr:hypothetical protein [Xanthobacteraceae bacterium]